MEISNMSELQNKKCIFCEEKLSPIVALITYPSGKMAHYTCHIDNIKQEGGFKI